MSWAPGAWVRGCECSSHFSLLPFDFIGAFSPWADDGLCEINKGGSHPSHVRTQGEKRVGRMKGSWNFSFLDFWHLR